MKRNYDVEVTSKIESELKDLAIEPCFCDNALKILEKRYLMKNEDGQLIETPKDMLVRVAANIAYADIFYGASYEEVYSFAKTIYLMMSNLELLPNSPALRGAGRETQQLSACFVLPIEDSRKSIFGTLKDAVDIQAFGGGTGFSFSHLRPKGSRVESTGGEASGPISFMQIYDMAVGKVIAQGGVRQGANMGILSYNHPDILQFIDSKVNGKTLSNFNISVGVTEEFMEMAEKGMEYELVAPHNKKVTGNLNAQEVLNKIAQNAHATGDPGLIFLDRINRYNPTPHIGMIESTNPCGELPLLPYESCNLASINLSKMVRKPKDLEKLEIDYEKLGEIVKNGVHLLDNVIDMNKYPLEKIEEMTKGNRKIGLGVMGWADLLAMLGVPYNSDEALKLAEEVMEF
ncbi:adenosylcobalamin-dependent ribonucleoside-diphosphate reductase, partial [Candidatus Poribacteria bacterium]|nr:adenosylcobalamin-dependent ribonucleoside-diphosphate reductase [Candidatus Poribacteria bacterium]